MRIRKISLMPYGMRFLLALLVLAGSLIFPLSYLAYAHTFSTSESAQFLSLADQIRAEIGLVTMNLENNNATLAQTHAEKASSLLNNSTLDEIRERNNRIADSLETGLTQLEENVTSLASASQAQLPQDRIQNINQAVDSLNDTLAESVSVRVDRVQQNNVTTWAMVLADLVNVVLSNYGNATGAAFDLTDMSNLAGVEMNHTNNMTIIANSTTSSMANMTTTIVDEAPYQSAQYLANNTILRLFYGTLKPLTIMTNDTSGGNNNINATIVAQGVQDGSSLNNNMTSNIDNLEAGLLQLKDYIDGKATSNEVMIPAHSKIHPLLMQIYGLTIEQVEEEGEEHSDHSES